jgi:hypothetical protein
MLRIAAIAVEQVGLDRPAIGQLQRDRARRVGRDRRGETHPGLLDRRTAGLGVDARTFEARGERLADGIVEALVGAGGLAARAGYALAPHQRDVVPGRQRAAAAQRGDRGVGLLPVLGLGRHVGRQAGLVEEVADVPVLVGLELGEQFARQLGLEYLDRDLLADAGDRAIGIGGDRCRVGRQVGGDEEHLVLLDAIVAAVAGEHGARHRATGIDLEFLLSADGIAGDAPELVTQLEAALRAAGQTLFEIVDIGLRVDPATLAGDRAGDVEGRCGARIAERDHRLAEAHREALDRAVADAGGGHDDGRAVVAQRRHRRNGKTEQCETDCELHHTFPRSDRPSTDRWRS